MTSLALTASAVVIIALGASSTAVLSEAPAAPATTTTGIATLAATCAACHGPTGNSADPQVPKLAGQDPRYLSAQLWAFKTKARRPDAMAGFAAKLSAGDIATLAQFYANQPIRPDAVKDSRLAARGRRIFFDGTRWPAATPPCVQCHGRGEPFRPPMMGGMRGRGMMGGFTAGPNLYGQHARYIVDQLQRFARGQRPSWVMGRIAAGLTAQDRSAVAEYLSVHR